MSREIKLRYWDGFNGVFHYSSSYGFLSDFFRFIEMCEEGGNPMTKQEFTGLKDRNGKEIFEKDILNVEPYDHIHKKWECGVAEWNDGYSAWMVKNVRTDIMATSFLFFQLSGYEVIGDIFTTPELIKEKP